MAEAKKVSKPRQKKVNGYKFPEKLPLGEILKDVAKKEWALGPPIGKGGFGEIYSAQELSSSKGTAFPFAVKIEPHENGPIFVEKHFYIKVAKTEDVEAWKKSENVKVLGIPTLFGFGSHEFNKLKYRFVVMERFGRDVWSIFLDNNKQFPLSVVYRCAIQIIDVLQYIHSKGYVHADIKGANLLLGLKKGTENNVFLVDFGLACKYSTKEFARDPKRCHNGTIEYTSRDWHLGVPTRRGDLEILGFNLLHWTASTLPWEVDIKNPEKVHQKKEEMMAKVKSYFKTHYPSVSSVIVQYLHYVSTLKYDEEPDYDFCRNLFKKELGKMACSLDGKLDFVTKQNGTKGLVRKKKEMPKPKKKQKTCPESSDDNSDVEMQDCDVAKEEEVEEEEVKPKKTRKARKTPPENKVSWKDAPTAKASNIGKAGEYQRKTSPRKAKQKNIDK